MQRKDTRAGEGSLSCGWHDQNKRTLFRVMLERPPAARCRQEEEKKRASSKWVNEKKEKKGTNG